MSDSLNRWFITPKSRPNPKMRLFCFPFAAGGASFYYNWKDGLDPDIEICSVQLPGRESRMREEPYTELTALAEILAQVIPPLLDIPYAFFGHSMGAWIAFEIARRLEKDDQKKMKFLFASGRQSPNLVNNEPHVYDLPKDQLIQVLRRFEGTPELVLQEPDLLDLFLPILRADFKMLATYQYEQKEKLNCPFRIFGGLEDKKTNVEGLSAWKHLTSGDFGVKMFPGGHFFLKNEKEDLLREINHSLIGQFEKTPMFGAQYGSASV